MNEVLKIWQHEDYHVDPQPVLLQEKLDVRTIVDDIQRDSVRETREDLGSKYFSVFDMFSHLDNSDESRESEDYESLKEGCLVDFMHIPITIYGLIESHLVENTRVQSTRFTDDIIFMLNNSKLFESGTLALSLGVVVSLSFLPDGFDVAMSLLLSAPLLVCVCGIFAKHYRRKA